MVSTGSKSHEDVHATRPSARGASLAPSARPHGSSYQHGSGEIPRPSSPSSFREAVMGKSITITHQNGEWHIAGKDGKHRLTYKATQPITLLPKKKPAPTKKPAPVKMPAPLKKPTSDETSMLLKKIFPKKSAPITKKPTPAPPTAPKAMHATKPGPKPMMPTFITIPKTTGSPQVACHAASSSNKEPQACRPNRSDDSYSTFVHETYFEDGNGSSLSIQAPVNDRKPWISTQGNKTLDPSYTQYQKILDNAMTEDQYPCCFLEGCNLKTEYFPPDDDDFKLPTDWKERMMLYKRMAREQNRIQNIVQSLHSLGPLSLTQVELLVRSLKTRDNDPSTLQEICNNPDLELLIPLKGTFSAMEDMPLEFFDTNPPLNPPPMACSTYAVTQPAPDLTPQVTPSPFRTGISAMLQNMVQGVRNIAQSAHASKQPVEDHDSVSLETFDIEKLAPDLELPDSVVQNKNVEPQTREKPIFADPDRAPGNNAVERINIRRIKPVPN